MSTDQPTPAEESVSPSRGRRAWLVLAGAGAAAAGGWLAWRAQGGAGPLRAKGEPSDLPGAPLPEGFWDLSFDQPDGTPLDWKGLQGQGFILNFWATWCPPCVEELPMLNAFYRQQAPNGWQVLGLAIDQPSAVRKFLQRIPLEFPVGLAGLGGTDLGRSLGNLTGGLPFTVVLGGNGRVLHRKMGQITPQDLQLWAPLR